MRKNMIQITTLKEFIPQYKRIKADKFPVFVWGIGELARCVSRYCQYYKIFLEGYFVNVETDINSFNNLPVYTLDELLSQKKFISVIVGHSAYLDAITFLKEIEIVKNVYCLTSCVYDMWKPLPKDYLDINMKRITDIYYKLGDTKSQKCLYTYFQCRNNDDSQYMFSEYQSNISYFRNDIFSLSNSEVLLDIGACTGYAIDEFINTVKGQYDFIIGLEPDSSNFRILQKRIAEQNVERIMIKQICAYNRSGNVNFKGSGEYGGIDNISEVGKTCPSLRVDDLLKAIRKNRITVIKINFPFSVREILEGSLRLLQNQKPKLVIRAGFNENVLLETIETIRQLNPEYKVYLRYTLCIPQALTIFAL